MFGKRRDWSGVVAGGVVMFTMALAGCTGSSTPSNQASGTAAWTTLGTRSVESAPQNTITSNAGAKWVDYNPAVLYPKTVTTNNLFITMKDGVKLAASVTLPADASGKAIAGKFPTILTQTGYNKDIGAYVPAVGGADVYLVQHGYAHVVVDTRGTGRSEGEWTAFGNTEQADYYPTVDWVTQQSFSDGRVGIYGASLLAITGMLTAEKQHPAVKAAFPIVPMGDGYRDIVFSGGQVNVGFIPLWLVLVTGLSVVDLSFYQDPAEALQAELEHVLGAVTNFQVPLLLKAVAGDPGTAYDGDFWTQRSPIEGTPKIQVPTFIVGGLHDIFQRGEPNLYEQLKNHVPAKLLLGPWTHVQAALGQGLPVDGVPVLDHIALQWFDQYEKGMDVGADKLPNVTQYLYGQGHFVTAQDWPNPQASAQQWYLHADKSLSTAAPAAGDAPIKVAQEPLEGICSESTAQWTAGLLGLVALPCFTNDNLAESLATKYDSAAMTQDFYINGPIMADLWISTTAADAGVVVRVDDVGTDGKAFALTNGIQTASMRMVDSSRSRYLDGQMIQPWHAFTQDSVQKVGSGSLVEVQVEIFPTSAVIQAGHKLRIAVGASDFPHGLPPLPDLVQSILGVLSIYSDAEHPSKVVLPVVPVSAIQ
ncbi:CocE/NonD family hydrolase [Nevskia soli]|uniref:CocE/NonD family hydrolase n=1 Tax=Nevskia soli TaxID=418856 RepID=UPI0004A70E00|nr:CocE/NonD family hydrolase [Nevskia soli]